MKNCGAPIHKEVATKDMMDTFRELAKVRNLLLQFSSVQFIFPKNNEQEYRITTVSVYKARIKHILSNFIK